MDLVLQQIKKVSVFTEIPEDQLLWLIENSEMREYAPGDCVIRRGDPIDHLMVILEGNVVFKIQQNGNFRTINEAEEGEVTGALPYSRAVSAIAFAEAQKPTKILALSKTKFPEMIRKYFELVEALVHTMTTRVREFTENQQQVEKMMALGKLSAGLTHELNNPASSIVRNASELKKHLGLVHEKFKQIASIKLSPEQIDAVNQILFTKLNKKRSSNISLIEKTSMEDEIIEWLENRGVENVYEKAETFTEYQIDTEDLSAILEQVTGDSIAPVLDWVETTLTTEKLVEDIQEASKRISDLVTAAKTYSHMDRSPEKEKGDILPGIESSLKLLNFKIKKKGIEVKLTSDENLPEACIYPGQLNQVWTNLLDNAIDAVEQGGKIEIHIEHVNNFIKVDFKDNGSGISTNAQKKIFDPFYTTKAIGEGTGLGLDVVRKIIENHQGDIKVKSKPGETMFTICLPIEDIKPPKTQES